MGESAAANKKKVEFKEKQSAVSGTEFFPRLSKKNSSNDRYKNKEDKNPNLKQTWN